MSEVIKGVLRGVRKEILNFSNVALKSGATHVGKELSNVMRDDENQQPDISLGTISNALKNGIIATGQELMTMGLARLNAISPQDQESKVSEESTLTQ